MNPHKIMNMKYGIAVLVLATGLSAQAALYYSDSTPGTIADNSTIGLSLSTSFSGGGTEITGLTLTFNLSGGFGSDLQGYLRLGNLENSPYYSLNSFLTGLGTLPTTSTTYTLNFDNTPGLGTTFGTLNPNNSWTLFFADPSAGGTTTFGGWSLDITAVPEPTNVALGVFGGIGGVVGLVRFIRNRRAAQA